jgi:hypothetical protein
MSPKPETARAPKGFTLTTSWAAVVVALLTIVFFHEIALEGRTFVSPDATAPAGFVRMGEQSLWRDHVYPLWNPYVFLGMPSFGSGAYNPLIYPPDWPVAVLQKLLPLPDLTWMLLYYFLAGLFAFLLAREWGARPEGALLGAVAFVFTPNLVAVGSHGHGSQLVDSAYLPLMLWLAARWLRKGTLPELGWMALAGGFQLLRGHVQICYYTWLAIGLYIVVVLGTHARRPAELLPLTLRALAIGGAAALAFGVAGVYNLPLRDYAQHSIRGAAAGGGVAFSYATSWSMALYELPSVIFPDFVGFGGGTYWGAMPFTDYPNAFLGIVVVLLAACGFAARGGDRAARVFAGVLATFALLVSLGRHFPLYGFLYDHLPLFNKFRIPVMVLLLFQLSMAMAAAWGWGQVVQAAREKFHAEIVDRILLGVAVALALLGLFALFGVEALRGGYVTGALAKQPRLGAEGARAAFALFSGDLGKVAFLGLALTGLAWFTRRGRVPVALASVLALVLLLVEIWPVSRAVMSPTIGDPIARNLDAGRDDVVEFLENAGPPGTFRVFFPESELFQDNRLAGFGISTLGGYHAAKPKLFQDLVDSRSLYQLPWLALLNTRYWVFSRPVAPTDIPTDWYALLKQLHAGPGGVVYEFGLAMPRATVVGAWQVVPDTGRSVIDAVTAVEHNPAAFTWLTSDPGIPSGPEEAAGTATVARYKLHEVEVDVDATRPAVLRLADLWYPDWRATVDGRPATVLRADHCLRAVAVPEGRHKVVFRYVSHAFTAGLWLSVGSSLIALLLLGAGWWLSRRSAPVASTPAPGAPAEGGSA